MKKYIYIILSVALSVIFLVGCSQGQNEKPKEEPAVVKEVKVAVPDGLPAVAVAKLANENPAIKDGYETMYSIEKTPEAISTRVMKKDVDIAIVPSNMAAIAYNKTSSYNIVGTVGMGSLYLVSTDDIKDYSDLIGKEVGCTGKGLTPDITIRSLLSQKDISPADINFNYVNSASELVPLLAAGKITTGIVPEPALSTLMSKNPDIKIIKSLNDSWKEVSGSKDGYPQSTLIIKSDFLRDNKEFVDSFLGQLSNSVDWANKNPEELGKYSENIKISTEPKIIGKALKRANLKYIPVKDMINDYKNYYEKLANFDDKTVGGKVPDEAIYFVEK
ncbi:MULTISPECIES: ABC transporter substrate-binding protein [unclassified Clostridioides]|uniref:ABC transporter substrate-binding protein n=1 Tax=unclassified Clostridioides TaxID=2635829 RepID=UPI001D1264DD|nr:ABC transporter substrate-binding protein [Clostridioides sp. ZZV14-6150]MCC0662083.1 ABC transporter substrate-binding protein [Clostridioides sp. ZZV14-6154]MCC0719774.1 ABC transporter substrate-binding protein [Clostridioides sp. ZZV14-6105]MCC0722156.1 ABC transporter substrate-binding protein [Clostridioides sp. ZZV14-6104]MCC0740046.1 ABC transporter substrate-binding protein [Clostridioides sp. ZZV14-5902]MCC0744257.1 ABC transporter substrate-binding protein [Clostridioides sp. ZZV